MITTTTIPDFLREDTPTADLTRLQELVVRFKELEGEIETQEAKLKETKAAFNQIGQIEIPDLLKQAGLSRIKIATGEEIKISDGVDVSITDQEAFLAFLKSRGEDHLAKLSITLGRLEPAVKDRIFAALAAEGLEYDTKEAVNAQTLKKYIKDLLGVGLSEDELKAGIAEGRILTRDRIDGFSKVYTYNTTKIK